MKIHFVCTSNTFRSRMAEAYLKSKQIHDLVVSSSGVQADGNPNGPVSWYSQRIIENNFLTSFESPYWTQTTKELLDSQDLLIFMEKWHYEQSAERFGFNKANFEIWGIEDLNPKPGEPEDIRIARTEAIYKKITEKTDDLIKRILSQ